MSTLALNKLLEYILSLSLSKQNKEWLAERLIESNAQESDETEREKRLYSMFGAWKDDKDAEKIEAAILEGRKSGNTRQIISFDEA